MPRHRLQLCNKCNKVALLHELTHGAAGIERARRAGQRARKTCRDTTRYISRQHILANRRNMSSRLIDWHAVRFIPEIGNMQGIDETVAWCSAVTRVRASARGPGGATGSRLRRGGSPVQITGRLRLSARDIPRRRVMIARPSRLRAVASPRQESTPSRAHVFAFVDVVGQPTFFPQTLIERWVKVLPYR